MTTKTRGKKSTRYFWSALWWETGGLDGDKWHFINDENCKPLFFKTRRQTKAFIEHKYGYIKTRKDLRAYPFGWRLPKAIKVKITIEELPTKRGEK